MGLTHRPYLYRLSYAASALRAKRRAGAGLPPSRARLLRPPKSVKRQRILESFDVFDFAPELHEVAMGRAR